jgi:cytochrome P450
MQEIEARCRNTNRMVELMRAMVVGVDTLHEQYAALLGNRPETLADPYPLFARLRAEAPVFRHEPVVVLTRYEDVAWVFRNEQHFRVNGSGSGRRYEAVVAGLPDVEADALREITAFEAHYVSRTDGEIHDRLRRIVHRAFTPRRISELEGAVRRYTCELLDAVDGEQTVDLISAFAYRLPLMVIADMLGIPAEDREQIHVWSDLIGRNRGGTDPTAILPARDALRQFRAYVAELVAERCRRPVEEDLVAALLDARQGERLSETELAATFVVLLFAGHETTTNLIGNGLIALLRNRAQWQRLVDDPGLVPLAVEELLRYDPPVQQLTRVAAHDLTVRGEPIAAGETVVLTLAAANRDPEEFVNPDRLDVGRQPNRHLSFAFGPHFCLGASLARLEGRIALEELTRRFPHVELASDQLSFKDNIVLRGVRELPVRLRPTPVPITARALESPVF